MNNGTTYEASFTFQDTGTYNNQNDLFQNNATVYLFPIQTGATEGALVVSSIAYFSKGGSTMLTGGFALSKQEWGPSLGSTEEGTGTTVTAPEQYSVYNGDDESEENTFFYFRQGADMPATDISFLSASMGTCAPVGILVNNSAATVQAIRGENADSTVFNLAGNLTLKATGYLNDQETKSVEFMLAGNGMSKKPESQNPTRDSLVTEWAVFDLKDLGNIDRIDFSLELSNAEDQALFRAGYLDFCMDNFTANIYISY